MLKALDDLQQMKEAVQLYICDKLNQGASDTVKNVDHEDDFGVWVDYPIVLSEPAHKDCERCKQVRRVFLAKMAALPSIATAIALHPHDERRGWILHELTMNSVGNIVDIHGHPVASEHELVFASRISFMTEDRVMFTEGSDGWALRCHEFIRLGQMPHCWPSVTRVLLQEWAEHDIPSERSTLAKDTLFKYARSCRNYWRDNPFQNMTLENGFESMRWHQIPMSRLMWHPTATSTYPAETKHRKV